MLYVAHYRTTQDGLRIVVLDSTTEEDAYWEARSAAQPGEILVAIYLRSVVP